jgi:hypothetical protein
MSAHLAPLRAASCLESLEAVSEGSPRARRNLLIGLWAGRRLGLGEAELAAYCRGVMECDHELPGDEDVLRKLAADLAAAGRPTPKAELHGALVSAQRRAYAETLHHD